MKYNKILVTGGYGFIGLNFIKLISKKKIKYLNIDKITYASKQKYLKFKDKNHLKFDIADTKKLFETINKFKPEAIIHFAAETHVDNSIKNADQFIKTNILGTYSLLKTSLNFFNKLEIKDKKKFKVILISTDEVFGSIRSGKFNEKSSINPNSPYAASKASSDLLFRSYFKTFKFPGIVINCSNNYGPEQHSEKLIPKIISNFQKNKKIPIYGQGSNIRNWLYVEDCCEGIYQILNKGKIGEKYNLGGNIEINNIQILNKIFNIYKKLTTGFKFKSINDCINFVEDRKGHDFRYSLSSRKANKNTGWLPKTNINEGLKKTIKWYIKNNSKL